MSIVFVHPKTRYSLFSRLLGFSNFFQKMSEIVISSSSNSTEKTIDEYYNESSDSSVTLVIVVGETPRTRSMSQASLVSCRSSTRTA